MKKLVFLHGSGADKDDYNDLMKIIANRYNAELISFNAPFLRENKPNKYTWFNKFQNNDRRDAIVSEYMYSLQYIKEQLKTFDTDTKNIVLLGHSQGGGLAAHIGLEIKLAAVISINGDLPYNISYNNTTDTPIYWFASKNDTYIDEQRKNSYKLIKNCNNFHYEALPNSTHNDFADDLKKIINSHFLIF